MDIFREEKTINPGKIGGYLITLLLFSLVLFFILKITKKMPDSWNYFHILILSAIINYLGFLIKEQFNK
jgi:hypothetical protein